MQCTLQLYFKTAPARSKAVVKGLTVRTLFVARLNLQLLKAMLFHYYGWFSVANQQEITIR